MQVTTGSHHSAEVKGKDSSCKAENKSCDLIILEEIVYNFYYIVIKNESFCKEVMVDHSLLSITLKGKTRKLHLYLVSVYGVPSLGIQSPSSSLVLLMGPVPNVGGLVSLRSRPYQPESVSDQPAP